MFFVCVYYYIGIVFILPPNTFNFKYLILVLVNQLELIV